MGHHSLTSLMLVISTAFIVPIILQRFKLNFIPVVIAEIIAGLIIGKSGFNIISEDPWLELLSLLGFIFLMFISGLEIDFNQFNFKKNRNRKGPNPLLISIIIFLFIFGISYILSFSLVLFGLISEPFLMTLIISTISLGIVVPVLKEKKLLDKSLGQTILLVTVISDFSTMILLTVYAMLQAKTGMKVSLLLVLFLFVFIVYRFIKRYFQVELFENLLKGTVQLGTRGVFALILFFVALSETLGAENILGAFLAGVIVSLLSPKKEFVHQLDSFGFGFFIPIFFVMVGVNLDIAELFHDPKILVLMPLLLVYMYIAKIVPAFILRKWYKWREVFGIGILTTSKLSLVIAASAIALELNVISEELNSALILVSILTCLISPISFVKVFPEIKEEPTKVSIIGANSATLLVSLDLKKENKYVHLYTVKDKRYSNEYSQFPITRLQKLSIDLLTQNNAFDCEKIVLATSRDQLNIELARHAQKVGIKQIIIKIENPDLHEDLLEEGFNVYSTLFSTRTLLKALIDNPGIVQLITRHNEAIKEIAVNNVQYSHIPISDIPFLGDTLILHIYRNGQWIVPHGDTLIYLGDRLLVSGSNDSVEEMRSKFE